VTEEEPGRHRTSVKDCDGCSLHAVGELASASTSISILTSGPGAGGMPSSKRLSRVMPKSPRFVAAEPWNAARAGFPAGVSGKIPLKVNVRGTTFVTPRIVSEPSKTQAFPELWRMPRPRGAGRHRGRSDESAEVLDRGFPPHERIARSFPSRARDAQAGRAICSRARPRRAAHLATITEVAVSPSPCTHALLMAW